MAIAPWTKVIRTAGWVALAVCLSATACSSPSASPKAPATGTVHGTVSSKGHTKFKGARVALDRGAKTTAKAKVTKSGKFTAKVAPGTYKVSVSGAGTCKSKSVKVAVGKTAKVKVTCKTRSS